MKYVTIFGGSGFLGRYIVRNLAASGFIVKVAVRNPNQALFLKMYGYVGQVELVAADVSDQNSIEKSIEGSDCVINCVAIFFETSNQSFKKIHVESAKNIAKIAYKMRVKSLIHISSL